MEARPLPAWFRGREDVGRFFTERMFATPWRLVPIGANGQLAFACYQGDEQVAELKRRDGGDILVFGSHVLWNDLLAHGLVDELHLMIGPVVVAEGTPAFEGRHAGVALPRIDVRGLDGSETVLVRYEVRPGNA